MTKPRMTFVLVLLFTLFLHSCKNKNLDEGMVKFDEAFIPTWFYVLQNDLEGAYPAFLFLEKRGNQFYKEYQEFKVNDDWDEHFRQIKDWLKDAKNAIVQRDQHDALMALDHVRYELMELRLQHGSRYYLDQVWGYEILLEEVVEIATDPMLCLVEYEYFKNMVKDLNEQWMACIVLREELAIFDLTLEEERLYGQSIRKITDIMVEFNEAVVCGEGEVFAAKASDLWPAYLGLISVFGDFEASRVEVAEKPSLQEPSMIGEVME